MMMKRPRIFKAVTTKKYMKPFFERIIKEYFPPGTRLKSIKIKEEKGLQFKKALKYVLTLKTAGGREIRRIIRGNVPSKDTAEEIKVADAAQKILYKKGFAFPPYRVPLSFGFYPKLNLVLYEEFPGETLAHYLKTGHKNTKPLIKRAAEWLAIFHNKRIKRGRVRTFKRIEDEIGYFAEDFRNYYPEYFAEVSEILDKVLSYQKFLYKRTKNGFCLIHGDYNPNNIIFSKDQIIGVIDFGNSWKFDPIADLANYLVQVRFFQWRGYLSKKRTDEINNLFLKRYLKIRGFKVEQIRGRLIFYQIWWVMQILAYSVSIRHQKFKKIVKKGIAYAYDLLDSLGIKLIQKVPLTPINKKTLRKYVVNKDFMLNFFNEHLNQFFPGAKKIISLDVKQSEAISETSFLTRFTIKTKTLKDKTHTYIIRGNFVPPHTYKIMRYLATKQARLITPLPIYYFKRFSYVFYEEIPGQRMRELNFRSPEFLLVIKKIASSLAQLHGLRRPRINRWNYSSEKNFLEKLMRKIRQNAPKETPQAQLIYNNILKKEHQIWSKMKFVLIHGDLQASNIIVLPNKKIALIDFTQGTIFTPTQDVANFLVHLEVMLERIVSAKKIDLLKKQFLNAYFQKVKKGLRERVRAELDLFKARAALDIMAITVNNLGPRDLNRQRIVKNLLTQATYNLLKT